MDWLRLPAQASTLADDVDALALGLSILTGVIVVGIFSAIAFFVWRYRAGREVDRTGGGSRGNWKIEGSWLGAIVLLAAGFFIWGTKVYSMQTTKPAEALRVAVVGKQWMWKFQHPTGQREIDELHVPLGETVLLRIASQDVIHSFYVPAFRVKQDAVPGRYTYAWFTATALGEYHLFCAEYCGTSHSRMRGRVVVMEPDAYEAWLLGRSLEQTPVENGAQLFDRFGCADCHAPGEADVAPSMHGLYGVTVELETGELVVADENYLRRSIMDPNAQVVSGYAPVMPTFQGQVQEEQLSDLIAYIQSLADEEPP